MGEPGPGPSPSLAVEAGSCSGNPAPAPSGPMTSSVGRKEIETDEWDREPRREGQFAAKQLVAATLAGSPLPGREAPGGRLVRS